MKKIILGLVLALGFISENTANIQPDQAKAFVNQLINEGILYWKDKPYDQKVAKFKEIMEAKFDLDGIARRVIGEKIWGYMDEKQRKDYLKAFREMLLHRYSKKFNSYGGENLAVIGCAESMKTFSMGVNSNEAKPQISVMSELKNGSSAPVKVEWYVGEINGQFMITDITFAGASMVSTEQSTFTAIQRNPENLKNAREACKNAGDRVNKCIADQLNHKIMEYMLNN